MARTAVWYHAAMIALAAVLPIAGCGKDEPQIDPEGPGRLLAQMQQAYQQRRYKDLEGAIEPGRGDALIRTLMAVDRLTAASRELQQTAGKRVGPTAAVACDLGVMADYLGPFSRKVSPVHTRLEGSTAWVAYQVSERVPIERAEMRWHDGRWWYVPDEADAELPALLELLTDRLFALRQAAEAGTYDEKAFLEEYARRIREPLAAHLARVEERGKAKSAAGR